MLQKSHIKRQLELFKRKVLHYYYRSKFTVVEWIVVLYVFFWLTEKAISVIIRT